MPNVKLQKNFDLGKIKLDMHRELNFSADIIVLDIENGIISGRDINGRPFTKLQPETIAKKRKDRNASPRTALYATGTMKKAYVPRGKRATPTRQRVEIIPPKKRDEIGEYHQDGGGTLPQREWFGISKTAEKNAFKMVELKIEKAIRDA